MISQDGEEYTIDFSKKIGSGAYGNVHVGRATSGRTVAVKCARDAKEIQAARKEVEFYRRCAGAPNIVKYVGSRHREATDHSPERFSFAMERALFSLDRLMKQVRHLQGLPKDILIDLLVDSTSALNTLKSRGIAHRDIKHLNILVFPGPRRGRKSQYLFKLCDMGVSSFVHEDGLMQTLVGTPHALCPVMADAHAHRQTRTRDSYTGSQCDLWSLGCTFYFVSTGKYPFPMDSKDSKVYAEAVAESKRPEGAISAEVTNTRYKYNYGYTIPNLSYPKWFRHCLAKLIATLFSKEPTLASLDSMVSALQNCVEKKYISIESMDIYSYSNLEKVPQFSDAYPSLHEELCLKSGVEYRLLYENELNVFTSDAVGQKCHQFPPILFPLLNDIPWTPKIWWRTVQDHKELRTNGMQSFRSFRISMHSQVGEALWDCDKILEVVDKSKSILCMHLEKIKSELEGAREQTQMPIRFTIYAKKQSFALLPFMNETTDKVMMKSVCEMADRATKELENCIAFLNQSLNSASVCLSELEAISLEAIEIPGVEEELNDILNEDPSSEVFSYEKSLASQCIARRADLAAQLCNNTKSSVVRVLLRTARFVVDISVEMAKYRNYIDDYIALIERPFQEMKRCVERMQAEHNLDDRSFQKALRYYERPANIVAQARLIREKVSQVFDMLQQVDGSNSMEHVRKLLPVLTTSLRKGSCGKIAVIGGSVEYTGAPYFAAISALKLGADLVYVMCAPEAAPVIKSFSPELIVYPGLDPDAVLPKLERVDAIVLGPGLGRSPHIAPLFDKVVDFVIKKNLPMVMDADGLWFLNESIRKGIKPLPSAILTPNMVEFSRLCESALDEHDVLEIKDQSKLEDLASRLSTRLGTSLFVKGKVDIITNPDGKVTVGQDEGSPRRCGGQGDVSSGTLAMFLLWATRQSSAEEAKNAAGLACSELVRRLAKTTYGKMGRSMITTDMINELPALLREVDGK